MARTCSWRPRRNPSLRRDASSHHREPALAVRHPEEALAAVVEATDSGRAPCVVVGALDMDRGPVVLVAVDGAATENAPTVVDVVLQGVGEVTASLFVASSGPAAGIPDEAVFAAVEERCRQSGVTLLEWFVPLKGFWVPVGETRGRAPGW